MLQGVMSRMKRRETTIRGSVEVCNVPERRRDSTFRVGFLVEITLVLEVVVVVRGDLEMNSEPLGFFGMPHAQRNMRHRVELLEKKKKMEVPLVVRENNW
jgi:hypothetical protein